MVEHGAEFAYDVFISYSHADKEWVHGWLLPRLEDTGLRVCIDFRDFDIGVPSLVNMERAVDNSRHTLLVLTPAWVQSEWADYEALLTLTTDPTGRRCRLLPLLLQSCRPPSRITMLTYADFTRQEGREAQLERVVAAARGELRLRDVGPQLSQVVVPGAPPFLVDFYRNPDFVGREEDMERLHKMIYQGDSPVGIRPTVLVGLGGIGKTQLAVEYAHAHRDDYTGGIFWLNTVNPLLHEFANLAETLGLADKETPRDQATRQTWVYLDAHPDALVVFDNVEEPANLNVPFAPSLIPANLRCRTLFTTRQRDFPRNFQPFEVKVLPEMAAMRLLLRDRPEVLEEQHSEWGVARIICASLGWLPLALELAAAYLGKYPEVTLEGYLERLRTEGKLTTVDDTELRPEDLPTRHEAAVAATLQTQWFRLGDEDARLLFRAAGQLPEATWIPTARLGLLTGIESEAGPGRPTPLTRALKKLYTVSLIEELTGDRLRLHPLVHEFAARQTGENEREGFRRKLTTNVSTALKKLARPAVLPILACECLLSLGWNGVPVDIRIEALDALGELIGDERVTAKERRATLPLLERITRLAGSPADRRHLVEIITAALKTESVGWSDRQRVQLSVYRAATLGALGELDRAQTDYDEVIQIISELTDRLLEDSKVNAQAKLGAGTIAVVRAEKLAEEGDQGGRLRALEQAVDLYLAADRAAQAYGQDVPLQVGIYYQLSYAKALLKDWEQSEKYYRQALGVLDEAKVGTEEPEAYQIYRARVLETASQMHLKKGKWLASQGRFSDALGEYETACELTQDEIALLERSFGKSEDLVIAHINAGDCRLAMSKCPGCPVTQLLTEACEHWRHALNMAGDLHISDREQEAKERLDERCQHKA